MYLDAVEQSVSIEKMNNTNFNPKECNITNENLYCEGNELKVEVNGESPNNGYIILTAGKITEVRLEYKNNFVYVDKIYKNGEIVYFDVEKGVGCEEEEYDVTNSNTGYNGFKNKTSSSDTTLIDKLESQNSCLKFYAFNDDGGDSINLLLDHNTTAEIKWNSSISNVEGPKEVIEQLAIDTDDWKGTNKLGSYTVKQKNAGNYTIDYSNYNARLITAEEVIKITQHKTFDVSTTDYRGKFFLDTNSNVESEVCKNGDTSGCKYGWLYDRTNSTCLANGCLNNATSEVNAYWTGTSVAGDSNDAWIVHFHGYFDNVNVHNGSGRGVRPVIEVLKSVL